MASLPYFLDDVVCHSLSTKILYVKLYFLISTTTDTFEDENIKVQFAT